MNIKDYICIPKTVWSKIRLDYKSKYSSDNPNPVLEDIPIGIKRRVIPSVNIVSEEDSLADMAKQYFEEGQLKILEE